QKREVVNYATQYGRNQAARKFKLDGSIVGRWVKVSENWTEETNNRSKRVGSGRQAFFPEAERILYTWVIEQRKQALAVTYTALQNKIAEILQQPDMALLYAMLVYDSFKGHLDDSVKAKFHKSGFNLAVIPRLFAKEWLIWMSKGGAGKTPKRNLRCARINED
ncbi:4978_t:CDS:2, partial [Gigaspora rosea]